jgi:hypothetical protein
MLCGLVPTGMVANTLRVVVSITEIEKTPYQRSAPPLPGVG